MCIKGEPAFVLDAVISVLLYQLFKPYHKTLAMVASALRLIAHPAIGSLNLLNHWMAGYLLADATLLPAFGEAEIQTLGLLFMEAHRYGYLIAGPFFGFHCILLGFLIYKTPVLPGWIGGLLIGSGAGYLIETFGNFTFPGYELYTALIVGIAAALGEVILTLYLLIKGATDSYKRHLTESRIVEA